MLSYMKVSFCKNWDERFNDFQGSNTSAQAESSNQGRAAYCVDRGCSLVPFLWVCSCSICREMGATLVLHFPVPKASHVRRHDVPSQQCSLLLRCLGLIWVHRFLFGSLKICISTCVSVWAQEPSSWGHVQVRAKGLSPGVSLRPKMLPVALVEGANLQLNGAAFSVVDKCPENWNTASCNLPFLIYIHIERQIYHAGLCRLSSLNQPLLVQCCCWSRWGTAFSCQGQCKMYFYSSATWCWGKGWDLPTSTYCTEGIMFTYCCEM